MDSKTNKTNKTNNDNKKIEVNVKNDNSIINSNNSINIQNINNNITIDIKYPVSFIDEDWRLEKIDHRIQKMISINKFAYSNLLKELLKNNLNQNVYIDKDKMNDQDMVYSNKDDKFIPMSLDNIINRSMTQINKLLLYINSNFQNERDYNIHMNNIIDSKHKIRYKYNNYIESKEIKDTVKSIFTEIFNDNNEISKKLYEELMLIIDYDSKCGNITDIDLELEDSKSGF